MRTTVTYYLRRKRTIYCNIRCNGFEISRSTGINVSNPKKWTGKSNYSKELELYDSKIKDILRISNSITPDSVFEILDRGTDELNPTIAAIPNTLIKAFRYYIEEIDKLKGLSIHTIRNYNNILKVVQCYISDRYRTNDVDLSFVDTVFARDFKSWIREKKYSGDSENQFLTIVKAVVQLVLDEFPPENFAVIKIKSNPFRSKKILGKGVIKKNSRIYGYIEPNKEKLLWQAYEDLPDGRTKDHIIVALLIWNTGISFGDLCTQYDIVKDIKSGDLFTYYRKKTNRQARVIIYPELQSILKIIGENRELWEAQYDNWLPVKRFVNRVGVEDYEMYKTAKNNVCYMFRKLNDILGVHVTPHLFRHSFAVKMLEKGHSMDVVAKFLGDTISTTERHYGFITNDQILREKEIILNRKSV